MGGEEAAALVVDNDSSMCNAGFAGDKIPRAVFPSSVGKPKMTTIVVGMGTVDRSVLTSDVDAGLGLITTSLPPKSG